MFKKLRGYIMSAALLLPAITTFIAPGVAHAATITWTGGGNDGLWSNTANWAGGVAPVSNDIVTIDNSATFTHDSVDDITGLDLAGINFINDAAGGSVDLKIDQGLQVHGPIAQDATVTSTSDNIIGNTNSPSTILTLSADVTVTYNVGTNLIGNSNDIVDISSHNLIFNELNSSSTATVNIGAKITDAGSVTFNAADTDFLISGTSNDYSGTTTVAADKSLTANALTSFGTSDVTIGTAGSVAFSLAANANSTIANNFTITGVQSGTTPTAMTFSNSVDAITLAVPHITLNGNSRLDNNTFGAHTTQIDLAGITANAFCLDYVSDTNTTAGLASDNGFLNGPDACISTSTAVPGTPKTGVGFVKSNPGLILVATVLISSSIALIASRYATLNK